MMNLARRVYRWFLTGEWEPIDQQRHLKVCDLCAAGYHVHDQHGACITGWCQCGWEDTL